MNTETRQFISENQEADIHQLALQAARFPLVDMPLAIRQINGKQKIKSKIPLFYNTEDILYPIQLSLEQSSSQSTAYYKSTLCEGNALIDLTGGFGIDCCFMSENFRQVAYVERNAELCELARHNFRTLGRTNIEVINAYSEKYLTETEIADWIYIDPARRSSTGKKVALLSDCEPDVSLLAPALLQKATRVMIKLSPMLDITAAVRELPHTAEIHVISVDNECKEVLLILGQTVCTNPRISTVNLSRNKPEQLFSYLADEETAAQSTYCSAPAGYLYEPNASVMKSGAFRLVGSRFGLHKLHIHTHLYTSSKLIAEFPGRIFEIRNVWDNSKASLKELSKITPKANISTRNYPLSADELRKKLNLKDGGDITLFGCTLADDRKVIVECAAP